MADILLSFGVATTDSDVSEIRKGLDTIITKIEKNPPKVRVGLTVDNDALNHFKKELEAILNTVSLANGAPITLNISGLGEISAQATQAKKSLDNLKKSGSGTGSAFNEAKKAINGYFKALADVDKRLGRDIYFDPDAGKWASTTKEFQYLADALTEAEQRFNTFASAEARATLTIEQQAALVRAETDAYNKYGISVEDAWKKAQAAADKAQAAADKSATQAALKAESAALTEATAAAKSYYDLLTKLKTGDYQIAFDGQTFSSAVAGNEEFVASLNRALEAYKRAKEGFSSLSTESQEQFIRDVTAAVHDYNLAVEEKANKDRKAAEAAQAAADKSATQAALKAESAAYKEAADAVTEYYSILTKVNTGDNDISFDGSKFVSKSGNYKELAASLTKAAEAYRLVRESASSLSDESQLQLLSLISQEIQKYNVAVEQKANKDRQAAEAAQAAAAAEKQKKQEYLSSTEALNSQLKRLDTLIEQTESNLEKWTKARTGSTSGNYHEIELAVESLKQLRSTLAATGQATGDLDNIIDDLTATIRTNSAAIKDAGKDTKSWADKFGSLVGKFSSWLTVSQAIMAALRTLKQMVANVVEIDSAMTELKKVTNETDATYERFLTKATDRAKALGASLSEVVEATSEFARLGYGVDDASKLADIALMYKNIGDGVQDVTQASESIVSTMQAFGILPNQAEHIVDVFNAIGNNFAITSGGIGDALQRSAAAMNAAGNTLEETAALVAAANTVVQNPDSVGKNLPNNVVMRCKKTAISVKGRRRSRPRKDFVVYARRVRSSTSFCYTPEVITIAQKTGVYIQCEYCGKTVYKTLSQYKKRKQHFCSNKCQSLLKREITFEHRPCEVCGEDMYISKKSTKRFCSCECQHTWQLGNTGFNNRRFQGGYVKCESCGKEFLVGKYVLDSDRKHFCSTSCRQAWYSTVWSQSEDWKLESRERAVSLLKNNPATTQTKPQIAVNGMLDDMGITYRNEEPYTYYAVDNYLPEFDLAVEVMGDYWHSSPLKYPNSVNDKQRHVISRDKAKHTYLKNFYDIEILYLWESDILKRPEVCIELIRHYIECGGNLQNYHSFNYSIVDGRLELNDVIVRPYQERRTETAC